MRSQARVGGDGSRRRLIRADCRDDHGADGAQGARNGEGAADLKTVESRYGEDVLQLVNASGYSAGRCALRKEWIWRTARGIRSLGSFQGNMLTSAFGASIAHSMATAYGCAGTSSGRTRIGFWQLRTKSRVTVNTKSGLVSNILVTNWSAVCTAMSGRLATSAELQLFQNVPG